MKKIILAIVIGAMSSTAHAGSYVELGVGGNGWPRTSNADEFEAAANPGATALIAIGQTHGDRLRSEVEFTYRRNDAHGINPDGLGGLRTSADGNRVHGKSLHANVEYDFAQRGAWSLYGLAGIGVTWIDVAYEYHDSGNRIDDSDWAPSVQVGSGVRYAFDSDLAFDFGLRYMRPANMQIEWESHDLRTDYDALTASVGGRVSF